MKIKIIFFDGFWTCEDTKKNPKHLFIYGDNNLHDGKKGQSIIRNEPNTHGIPTKRLPRNHSTAFYSDDDYMDNCKQIDEAIKQIRNKLNTGEYDALVFPENGLGTGLSQLQEKAPLTFIFLNKSILNLFKYVKTLNSKSTINKNLINKNLINKN
jgi:hypothetical protein